MRLVKLPHPNRITNYENLYFSVIWKLGKKLPENKLINVTKFYMNTANERVMTKLIKDKVRKENKDLTEYGFNCAWGMEYLRCAPSIDDKIPNGYIGINTKNLFVKARLNSPKYG